jgi:hypothetical protein
MSNLIQCELCDVFIDFNDYLNHVRECVQLSNSSHSLLSSLTSSNSMVSSNHDITSILGSIDSSLFLSNNSLSESFINLYNQVINDFD